MACLASQRPSKVGAAVSRGAIVRPPSAAFRPSPGPASGAAAVDAGRAGAAIPGGPRPSWHFATIKVDLPRHAAGAGLHRQPTIPSFGGADEFADQPLASSTQSVTPGDAGNTTAAGGDAGSGTNAQPQQGAGDGSAAAGGICDQPINMSKVISGNFLGGFTMDDYYPDLVGRGFYDHPGTGGPWDTGARVGANAQLVGEIRIPCDPSAFSLAQTVTYVRTIRDGVHHPDEGKTMDDIAKSGRDASRPPFRREFMGTAGWAISMADPPSVTYGPTSNIDWDRSFVTSLVSPMGRRDVSWSTSIRVVNGAVTRNTIS